MPSSERPSLHEKALARVGTTVQEKYQITRLLGTGGMAAVYAAVHRNGHPVAIKFLLDRHVHDSAMYRLFRREAYVANRVGHPGAVPVLDDDTDDEGGVFLIMPLLEGETLRARWERMGRRLPLLEVMVCMLDVLEVLSVAHAKGIVHRDIKPDNLFLTSKGEVRVLDFGIARNLDPGSVTVTGFVMGTPAFMPPEQALGEHDAIGPHSDCWAVGATMFALLSGQFVHATGSAPAQLAAAATRRARSLADAAPETPPAIAQLVDKALSFDRTARWPSAQEMHDALVTALEGIAGESVGQVTVRIRSEIVAQLSPAATERVDTGPPHRTVPNVGTLQPVRMATVRPARELRWALWLAGITLLAICIIVLLRPRPVAQSNEAVPTSSVDGKSVVDERIAISPKARIFFEAGLQSKRDASPSAAEKNFARALELEPGLAAAHLYASMPPTNRFPVWMTDTARAHYQTASDQRAQLSARDQRLLDATAPLMAAPPDLDRAEKGLLAMLETFPADWLALSTLGYVQIAKGAKKEAIDTFDEFLRLYPSMAVGWDGRANAFAHLDDPTSARNSVNECLLRSPISERCRLMRLYLAMDDGLCAEAEEDARALLALPNGPGHLAALYLAGSIYGRGGDLESVREALDRAIQLAEESRRENVRSAYDARFHILSGEFAKARRALEQWSQFVANDKYEDQHFMPLYLQFELAMELGDRGLAARLASNFLAKREAWLATHTYFTYDMFVFALQYVAGGISRSEFVNRRTSWLAHEGANKQRPSMEVWVDAYATAVATPQEAAEALRELPRYLSTDPSFLRDPDAIDRIGHVYWLAGDVENAIAFFRRAAASGWGLKFPVGHMQAYLHLGQALERKGDVPGACAAYGVVLKRWGKEPRSVSANTARTRSRALQCPSAVP